MANWRSEKGMREMPSKRFKVEEIIRKLCEVEVEQANGRTVEHVRNALGRDRISQRRACRVLGQPQSTQHRMPHVADDEPRLVKRMIELASQYGRYGYRLITGMLRNEGWKVNHKRVERLWRREGLKVPQKQPKQSRL